MTHDLELATAPAAGIENETWLRHRDLLVSVPFHAVGRRGCLGLGAAADNGDTDSWISRQSQIYIPDRDLRWFTVQDLPPGHWLPAMDREVHLATVYRTTHQYGIPRIGPDVVARFDVRRRPAVRTAAAEALDPAAHPQWVQIFNRINWAMTLAAAQKNGTWSIAKREFTRTWGRAAIPEAARLAARRLSRPAGWFPAPILGFPAALRDRLWERTTGIGRELRHFPDAFKDAFLADLARQLPVYAPCDGVVAALDRRSGHQGVPATILTVRGPAGPASVVTRANFRAEVSLGTTVAAGQLLGTAGVPLPASWSRGTNARRWARLVDLFGLRTEWVLRTWFAQQMLPLMPGYVHLPSALAAPAALSSADDTALLWEVSAGFDYFDEESDAFIFPPVLCRHWDTFRLTLTEDLDLDVFPRDAKFR